MHLTRRNWLRLASAGLGISASGWLEALAARTAGATTRKRACILLWMNGGPSQMDTFDLKPGHANGGPFQEIATAVPGMKISQHLPRVASHGKRLALVRSLTSREGDHGRATFLAKTGYLPQGPIQYPPIGSLIAHQAAVPGADLPGFVSVAPPRNLVPSALGPGFLGPLVAPLIVGEATSTAGDLVADPSRMLAVPDLAPPDAARAAHRTALLDSLQKDFLANRHDSSPTSHQAAITGALRLMRPQAARAFDLDLEPVPLRDSYGRSLFGQGCLLARRLVERGVPFVEVTLGGAADGTPGWDTHFDNFDVVTRLSRVLDQAWATLLSDLDARGLLESTLVVWMGEFGRTPKINQMKGRDHYATAWSAVLSGGGIQGGSVVGKTSPDGSAVEDRPTTIPDLLATICLALGIDPTDSNPSNLGRPIPIVDKAAQPLREILA